MEISQVILLAVDILRNCFGGIEIEILDTNMRRTSPNQFAPLGYLGVSISINYIGKYKVFLTCQVAEDICTYGYNVAQDYLYEILKHDFKKLQRKIKLENIKNLK